MSLPDQTPKLPKLPFLVGDAVLLIAAYFIAMHSRTPLGANAVAAVTACIAVGGLLAVVPFLTDYARKQDEALDERQRGLEALSRTITTAAEQIGIAANGLHEIADIAHKNLKQAEQLPQKIHETVAEFNAQLGNAREDEREELEKELTELRASESERLQAIVDKIHKGVAELGKVDAIAQKHLATRTELVDRATETAAKAHADAATALTEAVAAITRELAGAQARALAAIDAKLEQRTAASLAAIQAAATAASSSGPLATPNAASAAAEMPAAGTAEVASPPKRPRKNRREETGPESIVTAADPELATPVTPETGSPAELPSAPADTVPATMATPPETPEPAPIPAETIPKIEPVAPSSADPFPPETKADPANGSHADLPPSSPAAGNPAGEAAAAPERPVKKRSAKKAPEPLADLPLGLSDEDRATGATDENQVTHDEAQEQVLSSDGATRLIATAYIGIGNRLFIRGEGPGLSWEKGVPLQFVSIGKWRWETPEASGSIRFKLYKNDEIECSALGTLTLDPGHQQEVIAKF